MNELSVIDHAFIDEDGLIRGGSFMFSCVVTGIVKGAEAVVVDFSTIKKDIKNIIDGHDIEQGQRNGFDHKLLIFGTANSDYYYNEKYFTIQTPSLLATVPRDAVKIEASYDKYSIENVEKAIKRQLTLLLSEKYRELKIEVNCRLSERIVTSSDLPHILFRYVHGLKNSTSYGCISPVHGHLSFIQSEALRNDVIRKQTQDFLKNAIFVMKENIISQDDKTVLIGYNHRNRGTFKLLLKKELYNIIILDSETTVEYLAEFIKKEVMRTDLEVFVSEGLTKGAIA
jgi:hypothetical protein